MTALYRQQNDVRYIVQPGGKLCGDIVVPGDKSISHRAIMLGALANGLTHVTNLLISEDVLATMTSLRAMGVEIIGPQDNKVTIQGVGMRGLSAPSHDLYVGNSGTSMRLLSGLLAGQMFDTTLVGDQSLLARPMQRIIDPLTEMGASIDSTDGSAPLHIKGGHQLTGICYTLPVASAQVKSCLLLAGMYANGKTILTEPMPTRDHTERMLAGMQYPLTTAGDTVTIVGGGKLTCTSIDVPADISSAAFFMVGAAIAQGSDITLKQVGINPTRMGVITILRLMGADISLLHERVTSGEPVADIRVRYAALKGITIPEDQVSLAIDEFPALFIAAACAEGQTVLTGAAELKVKESDRIQAMADGLRILGVDARQTEDGIVINGGKIGSGNIDSHGDHRIAMAFAMAGLRADAPILIRDCANVNTSFPNFARLAAQTGLCLAVK